MVPLLQGGASAWYELLAAEEGLGRVTWILENTTNASVLEKA
jgi:hypothetical protein